MYLVESSANVIEIGTDYWRIDDIDPREIFRLVLGVERNPRQLVAGKRDTISWGCEFQKKKEKDIPHMQLNEKEFFTKREKKS